MADIRCSHCGKDNPDFLDFCQFCQTPLKSESTLHIGEKPTKKHTGELEGVLPDWLKNARQQARDSAEEDAAYAASLPPAKKDEPVDLLAGLFQSDSPEDEDVPDWLNSINPQTKDKPAAPAEPSKPETEADFFAQFRKSEAGPKSEAPRATLPVPKSEPRPPSPESGERDELSEWFAQSSEKSATPFVLDNGATEQDSKWGSAEQPASEADHPVDPQEDLSWLRNLENTPRQADELKPSQPTPNWEQDLGTSSQNAEEDLSWLNNLGALPGTEQLPVQPSQTEKDMSWLDNLGGTASSSDSNSAQENVDWLKKIGSTPFEQTSAQPSKPQDEPSWLDSVEQTSEPVQPESTPQAASGDLSWLSDLGSMGTEPAAVESPKAQEEPDWLKSFSEPPGTQAAEPAPAASQQDLSWLDQLGGTPIEPPQPQSEKPQEDLGWLTAFGDLTESQPPAVTPTSASSDLDWLTGPGSAPVPTPSQPGAPADLSWINSLPDGDPGTLSASPFAESTQEEGPADLQHVSPFTARKTGPLEGESSDAMPDWLKSATEGPSMPMSARALDQLREDYKVPTGSDDPFSWKSFTRDRTPAEEQSPLTSFFPGQDQPQSASVDPTLASIESASSTPSAEDVNALFSIEMPDWLSQVEPKQAEQRPESIGIHAEGGEALAPVDLPSWVQAMRPVDAAIADAGPNIDDQPPEQEGPLAGLKGLIPSMPVGSARRPKPISLKLQATEEQQAGAAILEQLLASETSPRTPVSALAYTSQPALRWALSVLIILVLSAMLILRSQMFPPLAALPAAASEVSTRIQGLPAGGDVLVVMDYEAALSGEMEAVSAPMLDQLALLRRPRLSFVSTSPNGPALVERLMSNPSIRSKSDGLGGYVAGQEYYNLGYLPGAESGVLSFLQSPRSALPSATVEAFSNYSAVIVITDNADSARVWIEQLYAFKQRDGSVTLQPLLVASSAQAGPMLQPYVSSQQINGLIAGLADAARFEYQNTSRPGIALSYLDAFGAGLLLAVTLIVLGSLWSILVGIRARRAAVAAG